ncbi:MAG TPA: hypothetical protein VMW16_15120 [Sedimentisphaerales bacterium]|nr:hypothetical protein [Sedimentisphaerales bacterium]
MAKNKKTKNQTKRISFKLGASKGRKRRNAHPGSRTWKVVSLTALVVLCAVCLFAGAGVGFVFLEKYVKTHLSQPLRSLELAGVPAWANEALKQKIYAAAIPYGEPLELDEQTARSVQNNLARQVAWLDKVKVQAAHSSLLVEALWRKPLALVRTGMQKLYVDANLVVLDFVPISSLPIVEVKGLSKNAKAPAPGEVWREDDLGAAIAILDRLDRMDKLVTPDKPLLYEIGCIDVSNFNGRRNAHAPHIVMYAQDNTEIIWGAEYGEWQRYLEAPDEEKLAGLYSYYKEYGSLQEGARFINLCDPQGIVPLPIDKY